jgi:hypothetical protein
MKGRSIFLQNNDMSTLDTPATRPEKFCPQCGKSTLPLTVPHISADCKDCGRTVHFVRRGENGEGIHAHPGERLTIPAGHIQFSLQPTPNGKLFRYGLSFLLNQLFVNKVPAEDGVVQFVEEIQEGFENHIEKTEAAKGLDLSTQEGFDELATRLENNKQSRDWYVFIAATFCAAMKSAIKENDAQRAAWAGYMMSTFRGLSIVTEPLFEETLWRGYLANEVVYEAAAAAGNRSPAELEALKKLGPLFETFDEVTLHALIDSGLPIGPKINVKHLPEELLKAFAKHQLSTRERKRQEAKELDKERRDEDRHRKKDRREEIELRIKWAGIGATIMAAVVTLIVKFAS